MRLALVLLAAAAAVAAAPPANPALAAARAKLAAMPKAEFARFAQRCKRRRGPDDKAGAAPASDGSAQQVAAPAPTGADRDPSKSLRTWTDVIGGAYDNGGPAVDMCVLAVTERAMHSGMVDVLNAEATTAGAANQELAKNRITTDGVDLTAVAERRPKGVAKLGVEPGAAYALTAPTHNPPDIPDFVSSADLKASKAAPAADAAAAPAADAAAAAAAPAAFLQQDASDAGADATPPEAEAEAEAPAGLQMDPLPGMHGQPPVNVLPLTAVGGNLPATSHYGVLHSYVEDLGVLVAELDETEAKARKLRMLIVEKDNFLSGLQKREKLLRVDMTLHKQTLSALAAHIQAVEARIGRLKQERQLSELAAQKHQFDSATAKLNVELNGIRGVSNALDNRIKHLDSGVMNNMAAEVEAMRRSVQPEVAAGMRRDDGAASAVMEALGGAPPPALLQSSASEARRSPSLRGAAVAE